MLFAVYNKIRYDSALAAVKKSFFSQLPWTRTLSLAIKHIYRLGSYRRLHPKTWKFRCCWSNKELLEFFEETLQMLLFELDRSNVQFNTWTCDLWNELDPLSTKIHIRMAHSTLPHFVKQSIPDPFRAMKELLYSSVRLSCHMLVGSGAPSNICTETRLEKSNWIRSRKVASPQNILPFQLCRKSRKSTIRCFSQRQNHLSTGKTS